MDSNKDKKYSKHSLKLPMNYFVQRRQMIESLSKRLPSGWSDFYSGAVIAGRYALQDQIACRYCGTRPPRTLSASQKKDAARVCEAKCAAAGKIGQQSGQPN